MNDGAILYRPDSFLDGSVRKLIDNSPWSPPLQCASFESNAIFLLSRADLQSLLLHLRSRVLVCDCSHPRSQCWALFLKVLFCDFFNIEPSFEYNPYNDTDSESNVVECDFDCAGNAPGRWTLLRREDRVLGIGPSS